MQNALKLFYHSVKGQYLYYSVDAEGREWIVITRRYENTKYYELVTAYRRDCPPPFDCPEEDPVSTYLKKIKCDGFDEIPL